MKTVAMVLVLLVVASGCSVKLAYNSLDRLTRWWANDYINMDDQQRAYFDAAMEELLYWHRTDQLPVYADFLDAVEVSLSDGTDEQELQSMINTMLDWGYEVQDKGIPIAIELLGSLSDDQVALLSRRLEESNLEWEEPEVGKTLEEARVGWAKEFIDRFGRFSGRLNSEQRTYVNAQSVRYIPDMELWADYRRRWQADLLALLQQRDDPDVFGPGFIRLAEERESYYGEELTAIFDSNIELNLEVSVWLINHLTDRQRDRFLRRLDDLARDFRELANAAPEDPPELEDCLITC